MGVVVDAAALARSFVLRLSAHAANVMTDSGADKVARARRAGGQGSLRPRGRGLSGCARRLTVAGITHAIYRRPAMPKGLALALAFLALPAAAQTTTTVTQQPAAPPPPPPSTTTVTTQSQPQPPPSSTTVVVNPSDPGYVPPPTTGRTDDDVPGVYSAPPGRSAVAIIATDALYGGIAGGVIGGGVTLIDQGDHWARNLMLGAGIGILAGAGYGIYEAATQPPPRRSYADNDRGASNVNGFALPAASGRF